VTGDPDTRRRSTEKAKAGIPRFRVIGDQDSAEMRKFARKRRLSSVVFCCEQVVERIENTGARVLEELTLQP
jgi:hypothetical protein